MKKTSAVYMLDVHMLEDPKTPTVYMLEEDPNSLNTVSDLLVL